MDKDIAEVGTDICMFTATGGLFQAGAYVTRAGADIRSSHWSGGFDTALA